MVDLINGADKGPLAGYVIAQVQGLTLIGLLTGRTLSPVYDLKAGMQQDPRNGSINIQHACFPVLLFGSIDEIDLPEGALVIPIASLSMGERRALSTAVENGSKMAQAMRAAAVGVTVVRDMPTVRRG